MNLFTGCSYKFINKYYVNEFTNKGRGRYLPGMIALLSHLPERAL
jgi:hypothetical protein